jgi:peptidoglycan/xylan/chitin deacetylase (PgdA/CDA1 family)
MNKIINFHHVNDSRWFEKIVCLLKSKYRLVDIETVYEFYKGKHTFRNACHITVDDGDMSFYKFIFPVLKKHKIPATVFVSPKIIVDRSNYWFQEILGYNQDVLKKIIVEKSDVSLSSIQGYDIECILKTHSISQIHEIIHRYQKTTNTPKKAFQNMSMEMLKDVERSRLVTIGSHTANHPILQNESDDNSKSEITGSVDQLSALLSKKVRFFSYPNGIPNLDFSKREETYLKGAGVELAFTTESKNFLKENNRMRVPRIGVSNVEKMFFIKSKLLIGSPWEQLKKVKSSGEHSQRKRLSKIFRTAEFQR